MGLTEEAAREKAQKEGWTEKLAVSKTSFKANSKALAETEADGIAKMLYRKDTGEILGVHLMGLHSADLIHEASNAMATKQRVQVRGAVEGGKLEGSLWGAGGRGRGASERAACRSGSRPGLNLCPPLHGGVPPTSCHCQGCRNTAGASGSHPPVEKKEDRGLPLSPGWAAAWGELGEGWLRGEAQGTSHGRDTPAAGAHHLMVMCGVAGDSTRCRR